MVADRRYFAHSAVLIPLLLNFPEETTRGIKKVLIESYLKFIRFQGFPKLVSAGSVCKTHGTARAQLWGWKLTSCCFQTEWKHSDAELLQCILITNNQHRDAFFLAAYFSYSILKILGFHSSQRFSRPRRPHEMVFKIPNLLPSPTLPGILVLSSEKNLQAYCFHCLAEATLSKRHNK